MDPFGAQGEGILSHLWDISTKGSFLPESPANRVRTNVDPAAAHRSLISLSTAGRPLSIAESCCHIAGSLEGRRGLDRRQFITQITTTEQEKSVQRWGGGREKFRMVEKSAGRGGEVRSGNGCHRAFASKYPLRLS